MSIFRVGVSSTGGPGGEYTVPSGDAVNFSFNGSYSAPSGDDADINFSEGGAGDFNFSIWGIIKKF